MMKQSILISKKTHSEFFVNEVENELAQIYFTQNKLDSAQYYASVALRGGNHFTTGHTGVFHHLRF
jgi:hypothetical protein